MRSFDPPRSASPAHKAARAPSRPHGVGRKTIAPPVIAESPAPPPVAQGLPGGLRTVIEAMSGFSLGEVVVHRNSAAPARLGAAAFTRGEQIHLGPGQERHLPHEAWHAVQQKQGRVRPTIQMKGNVRVNDDASLEREADLMGSRAAQSGPRPIAPGRSPIAAAAPAEPPLQMVRATIASPAAPPTLTILEQTIADYDAQISELDVVDHPEIANGFLTADELQQIKTWRTQYDVRIATLRGLALPDTAVTRQELDARATPTTQAFYAVLVTLANMRNKMNTSFNEYAAWKRQQDAPPPEPAYQDTFDHDAKAKRQQEARLQQQAEAAKGRKPGLGGKWKGYADQLKYNNKTVYHQHVPANAATIATSLKSRNILDAVYHTDKAFWMAEPSRYKLGSANGKARMEYTLSSAGSQSLQEDYLINGSGDFAKDNPEPYTGETGHPYYTIWKTNEIGAYGVGAQRLVELSGTVTKIEAFDPADKKITA